MSKEKMRKDFYVKISDVKKCINKTEFSMEELSYPHGDFLLLFADRVITGLNDYCLELYQKNTGRPRAIKGKLKDWVLEQNKKGVSSRKMQKILEEIGIKVHHNSIGNTISGFKDYV